MIQESGTYGTDTTTGITGSVVYIGQVTENSIDDAEGKIETRYLGTATRNFDVFDKGPRDVTGTLTYHPSDMRIPFMAIGSTVDSSAGSSSFHLVTETESDVWQSAFTSGTGQLSAPISFTLEDSKQSPGTGRNFIRTINGCVPNVVTISSAQGEKVSVAVDYIGQTLTHSSGTTSTLNTQSGQTPWLWSDCQITVSGTVMDTIKDFNFEINNNMEAPHYIAGSRDIGVPFGVNRNYTLSLTMDLDGEDADNLYNTIYKLNGVFDSVIDMDADVTATGSRHAILGLSGCVITSMENPSTVEGPTETVVEIRPQIVVGSCFDTTDEYNPF